MFAPVASSLSLHSGSTPDRHSMPCEASGGVLSIDLSALEHNYRHLSVLVGSSRCAGVVKADAYGLGAEIVAKVLLKAGCRTFFVAQLNEATAIRASLPDNVDLCVLNGVAPGTESLCAAAGITPVCNSLDQLVAWSRTAREMNMRLATIIQIDSGMSRLGMSPAEVERLSASPELLVPLDLQLVMSHLACGDDPDHPANAAQRAAFDRLRAKLPPAPASLANSAGIFLGHAFHYDLCRPGAAVYGLDVGPRAHGIRPVVAVKARVAQIRDIQAGAHVGYGYSFAAERPMRLATLMVGYADGWSRQFSGKGQAWCDDVALPIVGRVSMDSCSIDISALPEGRLKPGDFVELLGAHQTADAAASSIGTIGYEMLTQLGRRYHRTYR
jgi:alanine racemase